MHSRPRRRAGASLSRSARSPAAWCEAEAFVAEIAEDRCHVVELQRKICHQLCHDAGRLGPKGVLCLALAHADALSVSQGHRRGRLESSIGHRSNAHPVVRQPFRQNSTHGARIRQKTVLRKLCALGRRLNYEGLVQHHPRQVVGFAQPG